MPFIHRKALKRAGAGVKSMISLSAVPHVKDQAERVGRDLDNEDDFTRQMTAERPSSPTPHIHSPPPLPCVQGCLGMGRLRLSCASCENVRVPAFTRLGDITRSAWITDRNLHPQYVKHAFC